MLAPLLQLDRRTLLVLRTRGHDPRVERAVAAYSRTGEHAACWLVLGLAGALWDRDGARRAQWRRGLRVVAGSYALNYAVKITARRRRPVLPGLPAVDRHRVWVVAAERPRHLLVCRGPGVPRPVARRRAVLGCGCVRLEQAVSGRALPQRRAGRRGAGHGGGGSVAGSSGWLRMMKVGIVGMPNAGKSSLFRALTGVAVEAANYPFTTIEPNIAVVPVLDERLDAVAATVGASNVVPDTIEFHDIAGLVAGAHRGEGLGNQFLANIRETDAIVHVVRAHQDPGRRAP